MRIKSLIQIEESKIDCERDAIIIIKLYYKKLSRLVILHIRVINS